MKTSAVSLMFVEVHRAGDEALYEACAADGVRNRLEVFTDFAQVQRGVGYVKRLASEAEARAYAEVEWVGG